jgi:hypothetical protein
MPRKDIMERMIEEKRESLKYKRIESRERRLKPWLASLR